MIWVDESVTITTAAAAVAEGWFLFVLCKLLHFVLSYSWVRVVESIAFTAAAVAMIASAFVVAWEGRVFYVLV